MAGFSKRYRKELKMDILIVGTGALGVLFAARLARAGQNVTLLGTWQGGLKALKQKGARLVDENGAEQSYSIKVTDNPHDCTGAKNAIVLVKSWQTERVALQLAECLAADGFVLTLQNGLGNREMLAKTLGMDRVVLGTTTTGATLLGPGLVKAGGEGLLSVEAHPAIGSLVEALKSANFKLEIVKDVKSLVWGKLIINASINPLTALLRVSNGELLKSSSARRLMKALAEEAAAVASSENVNLPSDNPAAMVEEVARKTGANHSSMFQDIKRGAPTEIDAICGAVTRAGQRHNIPTPINKACWQLVQALVQVSERGNPA
jgi:2-dehydropantoate 2-reductase